MKRSAGAWVFAALLLSACHGSSQHAQTSASTAPTADPSTADAAFLPLSDKYGFVRMDALMRSHPLAAQLAAMNSQLMTLQAELGQPQSASDLASIRATQVTLQKQLDAAGAHAQSLLHDQGAALEAQERVQIAALIAKQNKPNPRSSAAHGTMPDLGAAVAAENQAYTTRLEAERQKAIETLATSFNARDTRIFKTKEQALELQETDDAIKLAQADSAQRVDLQTKAAAPGLAPALKRSVADALSALDAKAEAQRKAQHAANAQILAQLHTKLQSDSQKEFNTQVAEIRTSSDAQLRARDQVAQLQVQASAPPVVVPTPVARNVALDAQIKAIHLRFQDRFNADTRASVVSFKHTRAQLQARFDQVAKAHVEAQHSLAKQIQTLEHQRDDLITKMTAQIQSKTVSVAEHDSIDVVLTNVLAQSHAIDLTDDVAHELTRTK